MNNKKITHMLVFFSVLFLSLIVYLTAIELFYKDEYVSSNFNQRNSMLEDSVIRGSIYASGGERLAYSQIENGEQKRYYPFLNLYSHVIGYSTKTYGKSLIEKAYNTELLGENGISSVFNLKSKISGEMPLGNDLYLTIDHDVQRVASQMMGSRNGAMVAINPKTGAVIAMVSKPDFNPNQTWLTKNWAKLSTDENSTFFTRASMGLYPPGSTFKAVTSSAIIDNLMDDTEINDEGKIKIGNKEISNTKDKAYGTIGIEDAFRVSSNVYFASVGVELGADKLIDTAENFAFNKKLGFKLPYSKSRFETGHISNEDMATTSIGQGKTLVSPLHLAMITGAIANDGKMMKPYIVEKVVSPSGVTVDSAFQSSLTQAISPVTARKVKEMMLEVVNTGTGTNARIYGIDVAGKTGTAENERTDAEPDKTHALFIAFAPYDDPEIAVAVILEYAGGTGGSLAAPIAREAIRTYLR